MALTSKLTASLMERGFSRRHIARISMGAAAAIPFFNEFAMAQQAEQQQAAVTNGGRRGGGMGAGARVFDPDMVRITSNESHGPLQGGARSADESRAHGVALLAAGREHGVQLAPRLQ